MVRLFIHRFTFTPLPINEGLILLVQNCSLYPAGNSQISSEIPSMRAGLSSRLATMRQCLPKHHMLHRVPLQMFFRNVFSSNKVPIGSKGDISHWRPLSGQKVTTRSLIVTSDLIFTEHSLTFCLKWRYIKRKRVFTVYQCMGICPLWMF